MTLHPRIRRTEAFGVDGYPVGAGRYRLEADLENHSHDFVEIAVLINGTAEHCTVDRTTSLRPGSVAAVRPGQWHGFTDCATADVLNLYLGPELLRRELVWILDFPDLARLVLRGGTSDEPLTPAALHRLVDWTDDLVDRHTRSATPEAAVALGRMCCAIGELATAATTTDLVRPPISTTVRATVAALTDRPAEPWTMTSLADRVGVSVPHLHRRFAAELGTTPMAWLARTRFELAATLLIQTRHPVAEIARRVGWPDPNYFSRRFRELGGDAPSAYRARFR